MLSARKLCLNLLVALACLGSAREGLADTPSYPGATVIQPQALEYVGLYDLRDRAAGLTGRGVRFAIVCRSTTYENGSLSRNDYRPAVGHPCFEAAQMTFFDSGNPVAGVSPHETALCSILLGEDPGAFYEPIGSFLYQGAAPAAQAHIYELLYFVDHNVLGQVKPDADVMVAGFGNQFEDYWTRGIEALVEHYGLVVVAAIGNGSDACHGPLYPGAGPNVIGVGVVSSVKSQDPETLVSQFSLAFPEGSSCGPTDDGRAKPDVIAPGNCLVAGDAGTGAYEPTGGGSSFATPVAAGVVALLVQEAKQDRRLRMAVSPRGGNCVIKAVLMNSARKLPHWHKGRLTTEDDHEVPLDYAQGAGMVDAVAAYEQLSAGRHAPGRIPTKGWDLNEVTSERPTIGYSLSVGDPAGKMISATLVWNRRYETAYPFAAQPQRDCDLRLELWAVDPQNPDNDVLHYSDSPVDNVEHIYCPTLEGFTQYELIVSFSDASEQDPAKLAERFALAWSVDAAGDADDILRYDLNGDGIVDALDLVTLMDNSGADAELAGRYVIGDVNADGTIDIRDIEKLLDHQEDRVVWRAGSTAD